MSRIGRTLRSLGIGVAVWTALLLLFSTQYFVGLRAGGHEVTWFSQFRRELPGWAMWAVVSPLIFLVARRLPLTRPRNVALHLLIAPAVFFLYLLLYNLVIELVPLRPDITAASMSFAEMISQSAQFNFATFFLLYLGVLAVYQMLAFQSALHRQELETSRLEANLTRARLESLRMQLQPHFLFNTLHGISALIEEDGRKARRMLTNLSDLLRTSIEEAEELIPLCREAEILERYLAIQRMRFGDRLRTSVGVAEGCEEWLVPRFLLQPLAENSIKHGIGRRSESGSLEVRARCEGGALELRVDDDGPGFAGTAGSGLGLSNVRARLDALYGSEYSLETSNRPEGGAVVTIRLPRAVGP
ncbi:MAG TPA: sensor histidine kinase [Trueperaceae bacterium]